MMSRRRGSSGAEGDAGNEAGGYDSGGETEGKAGGGAERETGDKAGGKSEGEAGEVGSETGDYAWSGRRGRRRRKGCVSPASGLRRAISRGRRAVTQWCFPLNSR